MMWNMERFWLLIFVVVALVAGALIRHLFIYSRHSLAAGHVQAGRLRKGLSP